MATQFIRMGMKVFGFLVLLVAVVPSVVMGFDSRRVDQIKLTKQCPKCDLSEADLFGADLRQANLQPGY